MLFVRPVAGGGAAFAIKKDDGGKAPAVVLFSVFWRVTSSKVGLAVQADREVFGPLQVTAMLCLGALVRGERSCTAASRVWSIADRSQIFSVTESAVSNVIIRCLIHDSVMGCASAQSPEQFNP